MAATELDATKEILKYINDMPDWSKAICAKLRTIILSADPSIIEEWKWGPNYNSNGMICGFGAFQKHVKFTFYNGSGMKDTNRLFNHCTDNEFNRSIRYTDIKEIPEKVLSRYITESVEVNKQGYKRTVKDKSMHMPPELSDALDKNKKAAAFFNSLTYGYRKEFAEHITTAKLESTRQLRVKKVVNMCAEQKTLNHKYKNLAT